ncbi:alpha/beta hydrolase [Paenibacillus sp. KS-LC4]|uniref:alpha/beta hydrolase n=1 Tax=Paenibacillus sp. KS-LC4 TaxID=2979727 RepID=UPI0030CB67A5
MEKRLHPELVNMFLELPDVFYTKENLAAKRSEMLEFVASMSAAVPVNNDVQISERHVPGTAENSEVRLKLYEPRVKNQSLPGILYIHGGGYILGSADMMDVALQQMVSELECVIVSVDYRLAPEHPFPAPLEDCYAALKWFSENAEELGSDSSKIAVMGSSAGGGLTAALSLLARDRNGPSIMFQMLLYPMLDDRNITQSSNEITDNRVWNKAKSQLGWEMYLGNENPVSLYAAPARAVDLSGLPPTYACVGDLDPFRDETIHYVSRLTQAGVPTEFHLYPGCFHGSEEYFPFAEISQRIIKEYHAALKSALHK